MPSIPHNSRRAVRDAPALLVRKRLDCSGQLHFVVFQGALVRVEKPLHLVLEIRERRVGH